tara:strand:+ start:403 stop:678 length:276 start_codon:yes stop_codon:yes gene_type:complete
MLHTVDVTAVEPPEPVLNLDIDKHGHGCNPQRMIQFVVSFLLGVLDVGIIVVAFHGIALMAHRAFDFPQFATYLAMLGRDREGTLRHLGSL